MKRLLLSLAMLLALSQLSHAQYSGYPGNFILGAYGAGFNSSIKFSEDYSNPLLRDFQDEHSQFAKYETNKALGYEFGVNLGISVSDRMGILLGLGINSAKYVTTIDELVPHDVTGELGVYSFEEKHNSVTINPLIRMQFNDGPSGIYAIIGPRFVAGFSGNEKAYFDNGEEEILDSEIQALEFGNDRFSNYRGLSTGLTTGIGAAIQLDRNIRLTFDIRRNLNFSNLYSQDRLDYLQETDQDVQGKKRPRSTALQLGIEYNFESNTF
jgi:hypothetical protein